MEQDPRRMLGSDGVGGGEPRRGEAPPTGAARQRGRSCRRYSVEKKLALIRAYENSGQDMRVYCAEHELSSASLCKWRRRYEAHGEAGLAARHSGGNRSGRTASAARRAVALGEPAPAAPPDPKESSAQPARAPRSRLAAGAVLSGRIGSEGKGCARETGSTAGRDPGSRQVPCTSQPHVITGSGR